MSSTPAQSERSPEIWSAIIARGDEALTYLQGQLSQDIEGLSDEGRWTLVLAPDSAVVAAAHVTQVAGEFTLVVSKEFAPEVLARLKKFLLRTKCSLELIDDVAGPYASIGERLDARWPGAGELGAHLTPHCYGQSFVNATVSFTKGCFTGQELVGRLDARGASVPWRVVYFEADDPGVVSALLSSSGPAGPQGITSLVRVEDGVRGMGIAHRTILQFDEVGGVRLSALA